MVQRVSLWIFLAVMTSSAAACGGDDAVGPDPALARFVGTWYADSLTVTNQDPDTLIVANLLEFGSFFITVEESGQYTATLTVAGQANPEIGQLSVSGSTLTLTPTFPSGRSPASSSYVFASDDHLILEGPTEFDFNLDGTAEPADAHFELRRQ